MREIAAWERLAEAEAWDAAIEEVVGGILAGVRFVLREDHAWEEALAVVEDGKREGIVLAGAAEARWLVRDFDKRVALRQASGLVGTDSEARPPHRVM